MATLKIIGYAFGAAVAASLLVLLLAGFVLGFQFSEWPEWEGRIVGVAGTIAGVAGAAVGLVMALRPQRPAIK